MEKICKHRLNSRLLNEAEVVIPYEWPSNYGAAFIVGDLDDHPYVRIQSQCLYGDVFGSFHCDCFNQLMKSSEIISDSGGILIYLNQEGRGAGLLQKAMAYHAYEQTKVDSFSYYESVGLPPDSRNYQPVVKFINDMELKKIKLLTNNPLKAQAFDRSSISVTSVRLDVEIDEEAKDYISSKVAYGSY